VYTNQGKSSKKYALTRERRERIPYTVKKRFESFLSPAGMSLPNSPWAGIMTS
jgi:hypothetical protein